MTTSSTSQPNVQASKVPLRDLLGSSHIPSYNGYEAEIEDFVRSQSLVDGDLSLVLKKVKPFVPPNHGLGGPEIRFSVLVNEQVVGSANITLTPLTETPSIEYDGHCGFFTKEEFRSKGYGRRAMSLMISLAKNHFHLSPVFVSTEVHNTACQKSLSKVPGSTNRGLFKVPKDIDLYTEEGIEEVISFVF